MKDHSIVLNVMSEAEGEVLAKNRNHVIRREADGKISAKFCNTMQEDTAIKLTLTALTPSAEFETVVNKKVTGKKKANTAGILEFRFVVPARQQVILHEL